MSSILTNNGAMVALQTLKSINNDLGKTTSMIATGKEVSSAKDNSAMWAISKVMESDVKGFKAISDSLNLGGSTVAVAANAAETVTDLLIDMKDKIVSAQQDNVDLSKLDADVQALKAQIGSVVGAAQFNGMNLIDGSQAATIDVLSSLDRDSAGGVTASNIVVNTNNLSTGGYTANDVFAAGTNSTVSTDADTFVMSLDQGGGSDEFTIQDGNTVWAAGDKISMRIGEDTASYTVSANDLLANTETVDMIASGLKNSIDSLGIAGLEVDFDPTTTSGQLTLTNNGTADLTASGQFANAGSGGLGALAGLDITSSANAAAALSSIEGLIDTAIDAAASFGSSQGRIETQSDFVSKLSDSLKSGIGSMVDANMEEASARLQALQVQQQLGVQSLSIANQAPQSILSLFR